MSHRILIPRPLRLGLLAAIIAAALPVGWYLGSPLFTNQTVDESFPNGPTTAERPLAGDEPAVIVSSKPVEQRSAGGDAEAAPADAMPALESVPRPAEPAALAAGTFGVVDAVHRGTGRAAVFQLPGGRRVLRFEDFTVTNGPDLYVYLSGHPAPRDSRQLHEGAAFEVGRLKGNVGSQNYELPADLDFSKVKSAVIYCKRFSTVFSTAELSPNS